MKNHLAINVRIALVPLLAVSFMSGCSSLKTTPPPAWVEHYHAAEEISKNTAEWNREAQLVLDDSKNYGGKMPPPEPMSVDQALIENALFWFPMQDRGETLTYTEALRQLGSRYQYDKQWQEAERFYRAAIALEVAAKSANPKSARDPDYSGLIDLLKLSGKTKEAVELQKMNIAKAEAQTAKYPTSPDAQEALLREKAKVAELEEKFDDAESCWKKIVDLRKDELSVENIARLKNLNSKYDGHSGAPHGMFNLDKLEALSEYYERRKNYKAQEATLAKSLALRQSIYPEHCPALASYWERLARLYERHQQYEQAEKSLYEGIRCLTSAGSLSELARIYEKDHKYDQAATTMLQSITVLENDSEKRKQSDFAKDVAWNYLSYSKLLKKAGLDAEAKVAEEKAHKLDPSLHG
ncbi:MAG: tetratricopeptide repeat protein [Cyanobacteria bacterium SZAS-4]|nr:tetratricopeptide repeat protein [Cyanobacteria bacterium SZAS-4]